MVTTTTLCPAGRGPMTRRAPRSPFIQSNRIVIGVDIAKDDCVAVAQDGAGRLTKPLKFSMSQLGFTALDSFARSIVDSTGAEGFVVALEPTGHYGVPLVSRLVDDGVEVLKVEPLHTNRAKELFDGTRRKTDAKDAGLIAGLARQGVYREYRLQRGVFAELRVLGRRRQQIVEQVSRTRNRLHRHLDETFPELAKLFHGKLTPTVLAILEVAPTPEDVLALPFCELETTIRTGSRGQLGVERARAVRAAAENTIGTTDGLKAHRRAIGHLVEDMQHHRRQCLEAERDMKAALAEVPYAANVLSIPRLGAITLATLLGEFGDLRNFDRAEKLIKHTGLDLVECSSGKRQGRRHISRRGRAYARQMLFLAALRVKVGRFGEARMRLLERGKEPMVAAVANMSRLLRVIHALVRDGATFDAAHGGPVEVPLAA